MNQMKNSYINIIALITSLVFGSCSAFIDVDAPDNSLDAKAVFKEPSTAIAAVNNVYAWLSKRQVPNFATGSTTIWLGMYADELNTSYTVGDYQDFVNSTLEESNSTVYANFWRTAYEIIYLLNSCMDGLQNSTTLSGELKGQLLGEVYFLRAFCYWHLVNLFGDVPLVLQTNYKENALIARTPVNLVYEQMKGDLLQAWELLGLSYPTAGRFRVNRFVASTLLARLSLYSGEWEEAEAYASEVIGSADYGMEDDLDGVFLNESTEAIWQLESSLTNYTVEGNRFVPILTGTNIPNFPLTEKLLDAFEHGDRRLANWVGTKAVNGLTYHFPFKYKIRYSSVQTELPIVFRLGELYLIRAEALAQQDKLTEALADLNVIRSRAGLNDVESADKDRVLEAVLKERRVELFAEHGHRWFDLKRTGGLDEALGYKPGWRPEAQFFPIPYSEITKNPNLTPNPGY